MTNRGRHARRSGGGRPARPTAAARGSPQSTEGQQRQRRRGRTPASGWRPARSPHRHTAIRPAPRPPGRTFARSPIHPPDQHDVMVLCSSTLTRRRRAHRRVAGEPSDDRRARRLAARRPGSTRSSRGRPTRSWRTCGTGPCAAAVVFEPRDRSRAGRTRRRAARRLRLPSAADLPRRAALPPAFTPVPADLAARVQAFTAAGVAHVIAEGWGSRLRTLRPAGCAVAFVDTSRNGSRRFCSVRCANQVNVASHRVRRRAR